MDFKTAFLDGMQRGEELARQPMPLTVLGSLIEDIAAATEGRLKLFLEKSSGIGHEVVGYVIHEGRAGRKILCAISENTYPVQFGRNLACGVACGDSEDLAQALDVFLRDRHVALLLHTIWHQDFTVSDEQAWWQAIRHPSMAGVVKASLEAASAIKRIARAPS